VLALVRDAARTRRAAAWAAADGDDSDVAARLDHWRQRRIDARLLAKVTQHWFRHLLATTLQGQRTDEATIMEQMGWRDPRAMRRYIHLVKPNQRAAIGALPIEAPASEPELSHKRR
jgi:integrase